MIIFQTLDGYEMDLTGYGLTFNEESDYFTDGIRKSFTFPTNIQIDEELAAKLGLVNIENISGYKVKIEGYMIIDNDFFDAYLAIDEIQGNRAQVKFYYGKETLSVFDKYLSQLPWPIIETGGSLNTFAKAQLTKSFPEATHNFPKIYRPELKSKTNYEKFQLYVNNYGPSNFASNSLITEDGEQVPANRNVMAPMPYMMEILRMGFLTEGLELRGEFANDELLKKLVIIPKTFFEFYVDPLHRSNWSFEFYDSQETVNGKTINVYEKTFTPDEAGTYIVDYKVDFPKGFAEEFDLKLKYGNTILFSATANSGELNLDDELKINIVDSGPFEDITVILRIAQQTSSIAILNSFSYNKKGGRLNEFPTAYSLSSFLPNMKFRTFFNVIKKWLNLEVTYYENSVYIGFLDNRIQNLTYNDHSTLEVPKPKRTLSKNNLFRLNYPNGKEVLVAGSGQVYSDSGYTDSEIEPLEFEVQPISIELNEDLVTGSFPEETEASFLVGIYDGLLDSQPVLRDNVSGLGIELQDVYDRYHKIFLSFRANSEIFKDSFKAHAQQLFDLKKGIFKYNKKLLIKKLRKRRINSKYYKVDMEAESF